jgi:uncharacterized protein YndB with AHSA1/START domain
MFYGKAVVTLADEVAIEVRRSFRAPAALVWRAHTDARLFPRWMLGPPGWRMAACEMDVRPGGAFRCLWRNDADGKAFAVHGVYREVSAPNRLVHTERYDAGDGGDPGEGSLQTLLLTENAGVTTLTVRMEFPTRQARDAAVASGMADGMEPGYARLDEVLEGALSA